MRNIASFSSDGFADTDLAGPLRHRHQHDVHDADAADDQGDDREVGDQRRERVLLGVLRLGKIGLVKDDEIACLRIAQPVLFTHDGFDLILRPAHQAVGTGLAGDVLDVLYGRTGGAWQS